MKRAARLHVVNDELDDDDNPGDSDDHMAMNHFPFSAIVGQVQLKSALLLCAVDPSLGGVLIRGDKGSAKSTAARALADLVPPIARRVGCAFNCAPDASLAECAVCAAATLPFAEATAPFVTLPLGATEDRVLGTLDLELVLKGGIRSFQPGLLAAAHRGVLYVDEVNLLQDHLVDVLLDAAAMGVNTVQRDGISQSHPARFTLIGTMNPEEGDLRPQLLDRFGLMVDVVAPREKKERSEVVRRCIAFEADPAGFAAQWNTAQEGLRQRLQTAQQTVKQVLLDAAMLDLISHLCCEFEIASLRADIVLHKAARALAALDGRQRVTPLDVRSAAQLVLPHRRRRKPFEQPGLDQDRLDDLMRESAAAPPDADPQQADADNTARGSDGAAPEEGADPEQDGAANEDDTARNDDAVDGNSNGNGSPPPQSTAIATDAIVRQFATDAVHGAVGRRSRLDGADRGRVTGAVRDPAPTSLAVAPTLRSAAVRSANGFAVTRADLHQQVRSGSTGNLIVFVVDASGSMAAQRRMEAVKGAVLALLTDAYQQRDEVAVIAFRGDTAQLLLAPTRSIDLAQRDLAALPTGGRTPLPHALQLSLELLARRNGGASLPPLLMILTDGKANVALAADGDPWRDSLAMAELVAARAVPTVVIDTETGFLRLGRAAQLAQALQAQCLTLAELSADTLLMTIRQCERAA